MCSPISAGPTKCRWNMPPRCSKSTTAMSCPVRQRVRPEADLRKNHLAIGRLVLLVGLAVLDELVRVQRINVRIDHRILWRNRAVGDDPVVIARLEIDVLATGHKGRDDALRADRDGAEVAEDRHEF